MEKMKVKGLSGVIMSSANPEQLAAFYNTVMGIPLALNRHGSTPEHFECDYNGIHFAILKRKRGELPSNSIVPSFYIEDINKFVAQNGIELEGGIMDLGNALSAGFKDPDGNIVRLWMSKPITHPKS